MRSPSRSGWPAESVETPAPRRSTRPVISCPMIVGGSRGVSPCQPCRSDPQMLLSVRRTRTAPGATSGTGNSRSSNGSRAPV